MSATSAARPLRTAAPRPTPSLAPPRLRVVRAPQQARTRVPFVVLCMGVLAAALLSALVLTTQTAQLAFRSYDLSSQLARLQQDGKDLTAQIDSASSPEQLAAAARALGMVPAPGTGWIRLSDGTVSGDPQPAGAAG